MRWDWQDFATLWIVLGALIFVARRFVPGLGRKRAAGCGHCPAKNGGCGAEPSVVSIALPERPKAKTGGTE